MTLICNKGILEFKSDLCSNEHYFSSSENRAWKKAFMGFESMTSATPKQCSTNWANRPIGSWSLCWFVINPWSDEKMTVNIWKSHKLTLLLRYEFESNRCSKEHYISSNEIITLLLVRCFLQAFCINFTALICWKKSSNYILMKFYCESISLIRSCSRKNLIFLDQIIAKIAEKVKWWNLPSNSVPTAITIS